jgi:uroporphyrinogen decarboxylase
MSAHETPVTPREIFLAALDRRPTPRKPVALLSAGNWTFNRRGYALHEVLGDAALMARVITETSRITGSDVLWVASGFHNIAIAALGGELTFRPKGSPDVKSSLLESAADVERLDLRRLYEDPGVRSLWATAPLVRDAVGTEILVGASQWGPFTLAGLLLGVEKIMRAIYKDPAAVHRVLSFTTELSYEYLVPFIDGGAEILSVAEPTASGDLISRSQFETFALPYISDLVGRLNQRGARICVHICGNITNRLDLLAGTGADLLSVDFKVPLAACARTLGERTAFSGNLNPDAIMRVATPGEVVEAARTALADAGEESSFILMPGCDIPPSVTLENVRAMVAAAHAWPEPPAEDAAFFAEPQAEAAAFADPARVGS